MKALVALVVAALAVACAEEVAPSELTAFDYHRRVGIPEAQRIRKAEEKLMQDPSRIVGGWASAAAENPWQAGLEIELYSGWISVCGASLLSNTRAVTAAHCWWDGWNRGYRLTVVLGTLTMFIGGTRVDTSSVIMHSNWEPTFLINDIAIIQTPWITYSNVIQPIALPSGNELNNTFAGSTALASGWGRQSDSQYYIPDEQPKHQVNLQIITNSVCQQTYGSHRILDSSICTSGAGGIGPCGGDSGGPLSVISNNSRILVGITSFGSARGCQSGMPAAYARVSYFTPWIQARL